MVIDTSNFSFQGIGVVNSLDVLGCITLGAFNYNPAATVDDGSCEEVIEGCTNPFATNFDPFANTDSGACVMVTMLVWDVWMLQHVIMIPRLQWMMVLVITCLDVQILYI